MTAKDHLDSEAEGLRCFSARRGAVLLKNGVAVWYTLSCITMVLAAIRECGIIC